MAVLDRDEYFESLRTIFDGRNDTDSITMMENLTDTYEDLNNRANGDGIDWKKRYEENDEMWKDRYKNRFFNGNGGNPNLHYPNETNEDSEKKPITIDDLFE